MNKKFLKLKNYNLFSRKEENNKLDIIFESESFDTSKALIEINKKFSESEVAVMYDNELLEWVDDDWSDEYDSEYDWYVYHNNGEAQDVIITQMVDWYSKEFKMKLDIDDEIKLSEDIKIMILILS